MKLKHTPLRDPSILPILSILFIPTAPLDEKVANTVD